MNSVSLSIALLLASGIRISTPLILGALGETVTERAGHLNLGVEGMMMLGGALAYTVALHTESVILALLGGMLGAMFGSLVYAFLTVALRANQTVTGLALTTFGVGLGNTIGKLGNGANVPSAVTQFFGKGPLTLNLDGIENKPVIGPVLTFINEAILKHNIFVYLAIILAIILYIFLFKTRAGLHLRAVGESPAAADASGINVNRVKYTGILIGGALAGLAGAYYPLAHIGTWTDNITGGRGWIVVALVIFVRWHPIKAIFGSFLFGLLDIIGLRLPTLFPGVAGLAIFSEYAFNMYPYIMTIIVLIASYIRGRKGWMGPAALGHSYFREER
ncbi:MAG: ABC transporter permease [Fastidiosipilaceae bacterium]|jgi:ABC-type uncharacterized transport system permease subunit|nr:ABC transporter permease [Clostridiaceae bacterium]